MIHPPKFNSSPLKSYLPPQKERIIFPPSIFKGELLNFRWIFPFSTDANYWWKTHGVPLVQLQEGEEVHILDAEAVVAVGSTYYVPITPRGDKAVGQDQGDFNLIFPQISVDIYQEERVDVFFKTYSP